MAVYGTNRESKHCRDALSARSANWGSDVCLVGPGTSITLVTA
jgi:hypothetical protein